MSLYLRTNVANRPFSIYQNSNLAPGLGGINKRSHIEVEGWIINFFCFIPPSLRAMLDFNISKTAHCACKIISLDQFQACSMSLYWMIIHIWYGLDTHTVSWQLSILYGLGRVFTPLYCFLTVVQGYERAQGRKPLAVDKNLNCKTF